MTKTASRPGMRERCRCSRYTARGHASMGFLTIARRNGSSHNGLAGGSILAGIMVLGCMLESKAEDGILPDLRGVRRRVSAARNCASPSRKLARMMGGDV